MSSDDGTGRDLSPSRKGLVLVATVAVAIGLVALGALVGTRFLSKEPPAQANPSPSPAPAPTPTLTEAPTGFVTFDDDEVGFSIAYPSGWAPIDSEDPQIRLVTEGTDGESMLVRAVPVGFDVSESGLGSVKDLTDKIVRSGEGVEVLAGPTEIELGGLPGYFYFYSFEDTQSGEPGGHSHYFLFDGKKMISIVFQVIPLERFPDAAPTFDQIAATFKV